MEVLSPGTNDYDRDGKFKLYRDIPTLKELILIETDTFYIEAFRINESGFWELVEYKNPDTALLVKTVQIAIPISEIYEGITWTATG